MNATRTPHTGKNGKFDSSQQTIVWVLVVLAAFVIGLLLGSIPQPPHPSRIDRPHPAHPRRLSP